jgi:hypothetical protein
MTLEIARPAPRAGCHSSLRRRAAQRSQRWGVPNVTRRSKRNARASRPARVLRRCACWHVGGRAPVSVGRRCVAIAVVHITLLRLHSVCHEEGARQVCGPVDARGHGGGSGGGQRLHIALSVAAAGVRVESSTKTSGSSSHILFDPLV